MYSTEGIILKRTDAGEADAIFTIYTKDFGKIRARARGVKKERAKLKGHLEPLSLSAINFVMGRNGERLTHASLINFWPSIQENYNKLASAWYVAGLVDKHCLVGEKDAGLWRVLIESLETLNNALPPKFNEQDFLKFFEAKFLACLGFGGAPDMKILDSRL